MIFTIQFVDVENFYSRQYVNINRKTVKNICASDRRITASKEREQKMLRGINRQVIEISETDCEYFERVMFFVKPECASVSEGKLRERANAIAGKADKPPMTKIVRSRLRMAASLIAAAGAGAGLTAVVTAVFN